MTPEEARVIVEDFRGACYREGYEACDGATEDESKGFAEAEALEQKLIALLTKSPDNSPDTIS